jgi:hypothetical protein
MYIPFSGQRRLGTQRLFLLEESEGHVDGPPLCAPVDEEVVHARTRGIQRGGPGIDLLILH